MAVERIKPFPELPHSDDVYVLDLFGGVTPNVSEPDNPLIECLLTPVEKRTQSANTYLQRVTKNQIKISLAIGYLPALYLGRTFKSQEFANSEEGPPSETVTIELDTTTLGSEKSQRDLSLLWPISTVKFLDTANKAQFTCGVARQINTDSLRTKRNNGEVLQFAIPDLEIIRFYLTNSSFSCKQIFTGAFQPGELEKRVINEIHESALYNEETKQARFVYRLGYHREDGLSLARILFEPNDYALRAAQSVYKSLTKNRVNSASVIGYPNTFFPFRQIIQLTVKGRRLETKPINDAEKNYIFLVNQIVACTGKFPFSELSFYCDTAPGTDPASDDADVAFASQLYLDRGPTHGSNKNGYSVSDARPSATAEAIITSLEQRIFYDSDNVAQEFKPTRPSTYRSQKRIRRNDDLLMDASTGKGTSGKSTGAKLVIKDENIPKPVLPSLPADLETFKLVLKGIAFSKPEWDLSPVPISDSEPYSFFPEVPCEKRKSWMRVFSFMDSERIQRRALLCTQVKIDDLYFYLFEAQRRPRDNSDGTKEQMPILLIRKPDYGILLGRDFSAMLIKTVELKTWPPENEMTSFIRDQTAHGMGATKTDDLSERIISMINKNLPKKNEVILSINNLDEA